MRSPDSIVSVQLQTWTPRLTGCFPGDLSSVSEKGLTQCVLSQPASQPKLFKRTLKFVCILDCVIEVSNWNMRSGKD